MATRLRKATLAPVPVPESLVPMPTSKTKRQNATMPMTVLATKLLQKTMR